MTKLIRSDYKRFFHDKMFIVMIILAIFFAVTTPLLYVAIMGMAGGVDPTTEEMLSGYVNAKGQFFSAFSFGNNFGLIAPLLLILVLFKDFTFGTIRNKIIGGHSRKNIYLSLFTVCFTTLFGMVLAHALLTLCVSLPFFEYQSTPFTAGDLGYFFLSLLLELITYLFIAAFLSWLCAICNSTGLVIILYIAVVFGATLLAGILQVVIAVLEFAPNMESTIKLLNFIQRLNVFNSTATIGIGTSYTAKDLLFYLLPPLAGSALFLGHGLHHFGQKDFK